MVRRDRPAASFVDLLRRRADVHPERTAFVFLVDGGPGETRLTYGELDRQARAVAAAVQGIARPGERVLLLHPPGLEFVSAFFGCLYAGTIAVPAYPPDPARLARTLPRLRRIVADAGATLVLTTADLQGAAALLGDDAPELGALPWLAGDATDAGAEARWRAPAVRGETVALLQYTSGSTAEPRGVVLSHENLLANSALIRHAFGHSAESVGVVWAPFYHDLGLIGGVLQPVFLGTATVLLSPIAFLRRPIRWLEAVSRYRGTTSGGPNFAYDLCVDRTTPAERAGLDLASWRVAFNAAEPVRASTLDRFARAFAPCGFRPEAFYPCYGLAESTLIVSGGAAGAAPVRLSADARALEHGRLRRAARARGEARALVGCGRSLPGHAVRVVDSATRHPCPPGRVGEIWVAGPSVGRGYWRRPAESARVFGARLAGGEGPFLRTGDLGVLRDGELYVTGRAKDVVIVRGRNLYPQDIEATAERSHPALRAGCGAAFPVAVADEERLVVVHEVDRTPGLDPAAVIEAIRARVSAEQEVQVNAVVLIAPRSIPKTSSGKIRRHATRAELLAGALDTVAAWGLASVAGAEPPLVAA
jgi:acyl-CoA synthetase (AMP-forming)/AMP-acid ligase II